MQTETEENVKHLCIKFYENPIRVPRVLSRV
jgi:hypothetical protein